MEWSLWFWLAKVRCLQWYLFPATSQMLAAAPEHPPREHCCLECLPTNAWVHYPPPFPSAGWLQDKLMYVISMQSCVDIITVVPMLLAYFIPPVSLAVLV